MSQKLKKKQVPARKSSLFWRILFPPFDELQFILLLFIFMIAPQGGTPYIWNFTSEVANLLLDGAWISFIFTVFLLFIAGILLLIILAKTKLPHDMKAYMSMLFYVALAYMAMNSPTFFTTTPTEDLATIQIINLYIISILSMVASVRAFIAIISIRFDSVSLQKLVSQNFSDRQMHAWQFLVGCSLAGLVMVWVYATTENHAQIVVLTYVYSYAIYKLIEGIVSYISPRNNKRVKHSN